MAVCSGRWPPQIPQVAFGMTSAMDSRGGLSGVFAAILGPIVADILDEVRNCPSTSRVSTGWLAVSGSL
eukprot:scaffold137727_cov35-Tisochrysis_lutea.AAC.8